MPLSVSCNSQHLYPVNSEAALLLEQFYACPDAASVMEQIHSIVDVVVGNFPHNRISYDPHSEDMEIQIPNRMLGTEDALPALIWEIFNAIVMPTINKLNEKAAAGHLGMDEYATLYEQEEFFSKKQTDALIKSCQAFYKIEPAPGSPDLDYTLWNHEIHCHTDKIRERWIANFQALYCSNHPEDLKSCLIKKEDLCDFYRLQQLPPSEKNEVIKERIYEKLPTASPKIKEFYESKIRN